MTFFNNEDKPNKIDLKEVLQGLLTNKDSNTPKKYVHVTVVDNATGVETSGTIIEYTRDRILLEVSFDAQKVHFK